jgi:SAM-dependent methyltransferase
MPFNSQDLLNAFQEYLKFARGSDYRNHARYIFPFFEGTYFTYRKIDVLRIVTIARAITSDPQYLDVGCGYGDFLNKVTQHIPSAIGVEKDATIYYYLNRPKPEYIISLPIECVTQPIDVAFIGWMEPGVDFRLRVADIAKCIITTFDEGGQCGINGGCEYEEFGYSRVAWWRTPSWIDVNHELMNSYYSRQLANNSLLRNSLRDLRSAHNLWYVYVRDEYLKNRIKSRLMNRLKKECPTSQEERFEFEQILDECGFQYKTKLPSMHSSEKLWEVYFD